MSIIIFSSDLALFEVPPRPVTSESITQRHMTRNNKVRALADRRVRGAQVLVGTSIP